MTFWNAALHEPATCSSCGEEYQRRWMEKFNTGRRTQLLCPECYRKATMDIYAARGERVYHMNKNRR